MLIQKLPINALLEAKTTLLALIYDAMNAHDDWHNAKEYRRTMKIKVGFNPNASIEVTVVEIEAELARRGIFDTTKNGG